MGKPAERRGVPRSKRGKPKDDNKKTNKSEETAGQRMADQAEDAAGKLPKEPKVYSFLDRVETMINKVKEVTSSVAQYKKAVEGGGDIEIAMGTAEKALKAARRRLDAAHIALLAGYGAAKITPPQEQEALFESE